MRKNQGYRRAGLANVAIALGIIFAGLASVGWLHPGSKESHSANHEGSGPGVGRPDFDVRQSLELAQSLGKAIRIDADRSRCPRMTIAPIDEVFGQLEPTSLRPGDPLRFEVSGIGTFCGTVRSNDRSGERISDRSIVATMDNDPFGRMILSTHGEALYATVLGAKAGDFEIRKISSRTVIALSGGPHNLLKCGVPAADGLSDIPGFREKVGHTSRSRRSSPVISTVQDVLVLFTESARIIVGGNPLDPGDDGAIRAKIASAIAAANTAYIDSNLPLMLNAVGVMGVNYSYPTMENLSRGLRELTSKTDGILDEVHTIRDQVGADIVSLWLETNASGGQANVLTQTNAGLAPAFNLVRAQQMVSTFVHEVGHNQGCRHLRAGYTTLPSSWFPDSFAHLFTASAQNYTTIMASTTESSANSATRLLRFSAPELAYLGAATGVAGLADCARTVRATGPVIEAFRTRADAVVVRPLLKIRGKSRITTRRSGIVLRGTAYDPTGVTAVRAKGTGLRGFQTARGTSSWRIRVRVTQPRVVRKIYAFNAAGVRSKIGKVRIFRR